MNYDEVMKYAGKLAHILGISYSVQDVYDFVVRFEKSDVKMVCVVNTSLSEKYIKYKIKITAFQVLERLVEREMKG